MSDLVGLNVQTPDAFGTLSKLLSLRSQQQQLAGQAAEVQGLQQTQRQRAALADYDWGSHIGADGTVDLNSLNDPKLRAAAGDQYLDVLQHAATAKTAQLQSRQTLLGLTNDQREAFTSMMGALRSDKDVTDDSEKGRQKVNQAMVQFGQMYGEDALPVLQAYAAPLQQAPKGKLSDALRVVQLQGHSASQQLAAQAPDYANTGPELHNVNPNAPAGTAPNVGLGMGPGIFVDPRTQNPYVTGGHGVSDLTQQPGSPQGPPGAAPGAGAAAPSAAPNAGPAGSMPRPFYPGQGHDIAAQQAEVQGIRAAGDAAPINRNIYQEILKLGDETKTGALTSWMQKNPVISQAFGDNYQMMSKFLEKQALTNMSAMGAPSDARLDAAVAANGSTKFNAKALKAVTQFNYATNTGIEKFRQGIDAAIGTSNPDYTKLPKFKAAWAKNFDVDVFRLENAIKDGDTKTQHEMLDTISPAKAQELVQKRRNLEALSTTGALP